MTSDMPNVAYSITVRLDIAADPAAVGLLTTAVGSAGGAVIALDVTESRSDRLSMDVTCLAHDDAHATTLTDALAAVFGVTIRKVSDRTFLLHLGGKIEVRSKVPCGRATTCRWPTPRAWPGSAVHWWPIPRTHDG